MASATRRPCPTPFCRNVVTGGGYCPEHARQRERERKQALRRIHPDAAYSTPRWRKARALYLAAHPHCLRCMAPATVVDHIVPHKGDDVLFWDEGNWQPLCARCHNRKTGLEQR